jgi:hypothetical protein
LRFVPSLGSSGLTWAVFGAVILLVPLFVIRLVSLEAVFPDLSEIPVGFEALERLLALLAEIEAPNNLLVVELGPDKQALTVVPGRGHAMLRFGPGDEGYKSESWFRLRGLPVFKHEFGDESFFDVPLPVQAPAATLLNIVAHLHGRPELDLVSVSVRGDKLIELATHDVFRAVALHALNALPGNLTL